MYRHPSDTPDESHFGGPPKRRPPTAVGIMTPPPPPRPSRVATLSRFERWAKRWFQLLSFLKLRRGMHSA